MGIAELLEELSFGERVAEDDTNLKDYFIETMLWNKILNDEIDIVKGVKGSGKSAIYRKLLDIKSELHNNNIDIIAAEELRGQTVFKRALGSDNISEEAFKQIWKLYIITLIGSELQTQKYSNKYAKELIKHLAEEGLLKENTLLGIVNSVKNYVSSMHGKKVESVEATVSCNESGTIPIYGGKITFKDNFIEKKELGYISVDELLDLSNKALDQIGVSFWIVFDRLDVAFESNPGLETIALRSLFKVYNDLKSYERFKLKIFIRDDIWKQITKNGFREASHIIREESIEWNDEDLFYLIISRLVDNKLLCDQIGEAKDSILKNKDLQDKLFYTVFPDTINSGKTSTTFNWLLSRIEDGLCIRAPRELIHLLNTSKDKQINKLKLGEKECKDNAYISKSAVKEGLVTVSKTRLEQTILAEYPDVKPYIDKLKSGKTSYSLKDLSIIFAISQKETKPIVDRLCEIGFFRIKKTKIETKEVVTYWLPFLYRDAMEAVQGKYNH